MSTNQAQYTAQAAGQSQAEKILARLLLAPNQWVSMPELVRASGSYNVHSRISDLRADGYTIEHKNEFEATETHRTVKSYYRLVLTK